MCRDCDGRSPALSSDLLNAIEQLRDAIRVAASAVTRSGELDALRAGEVSGADSTVIDRFEQSGKRFVVVCEEAGRSPRLAALTDREHQVLGQAALGHDNKTIAYELGLAHSTVRVLMARAAVKLGVRTRADALARYLASSEEGGRFPGAAGPRWSASSASAALQPPQLASASITENGD